MRSELDVVRDESAQAWTWLEETVADVGAAEANWWPPATANSIGTTYLHVVVNTDVEVARLVFDRVPLIERDWGGNVGQGVPYDAEHFDRWRRDVDVDWTRLRAYGAAVGRALLDELRELTPDLLDRPVDMTRSGLGMWQARDLLTLHGDNHVRIHGGEIAVLKGVQGGVGWAQSERFADPAPFRAGPPG